jgi:hypothetical protein
LTNKVWDCRGLAVDKLNERLSPLVAGGWLIEMDKDKRLCRNWRINRAAIDHQFTERMRIEEERKQSLAQLMRSGRRGSVWRFLARIFLAFSGIRRFAPA